MRIATLIALVAVGVAAIAFGGLYGLSEAKLRDVDAGDAFDHAIPTDAASIERGRHIARTRGCFGCHGQQLQGKDFGEQWDWPKRAVAPNLATYARDNEPAVIEAAIRQGIGRDGRALVSMPSFNFARLTDEDTAALIAFLRSAPVVESELPKPELGWAVRMEIATGATAHMADWADRVPPLRVDAREEPERAHGEYLAMTMCNECHGLDLRGATIYPPSTPDLAMVAAYERTAFEDLIYTGITAGGRKLILMSLVAPDRYPDLNEEEIEALYLYLTSLAYEPAPENVFWRPTP